MGQLNWDHVTYAESIHRQLQEIVLREIAHIPEYVEQLTPPERVKFILSILPFTTPRVEACAAHFAEPL